MDTSGSNKLSTAWLPATGSRLTSSGLAACTEQWDFLDAANLKLVHKTNWASPASQIAETV